MPLPPLPDDVRHALQPYMQRAAEMAARDPAVAYWCKMHAARLALGLTASQPAVRPWLVALMDELEMEKQRLAATTDLVTDEAGAHAHLETFALKIFALADREDRAGRASVRTAKTFVAAANYLEVLAVFGDDALDETIAEKIKYAKFKATDILKALKAGETPRPGPPPGAGGDEEVLGMAPAPGGLPSPPANPPSPGTHPPSQWDSAAASHPPTAPPQAPYSPSAPAPTATAPYNPPPPSLPPANQHHYQYAPQQPSPVASAPAAAYQLAHDPHVLAQAQKHARYVISALEYDDVPTAVTNLRQALALLEPYTKK